MAWSSHRLLTGLVAAALAACGGETGPPRVELDRSACARCGMLISEPRFAAAYRAEGEAAVFDDIGCLLGALDQAGLDTEANGAGPHADVWFLDQEERWLRSSDVLFVRSPELVTPMGGGMQALASRDAAEELASSAGGSIVETLHDLRVARRAAAASGSSS